MTETNNNDMDKDCRLLLSRSSVEVGGADTTTNRQWECCRRVGGSLQ
jgi:hypothetical protein